MAPSSAESTASAAATFTLPPRPDDIATDGTCDEGWRCLGLLTPGAHRTKYVKPNFSFEIAEPGWENLRGAGGLFDIRPTDSPGDELWFLQEVTARSAEGERPFGVSGSAQELADWLAAREDLVVEGPETATVGGLDGMMLTIRVRDDAASGLHDCDAEPCVLLLGGADPAERSTWDWTWALSRGQAMQLWLLDAGDQIVGLNATAWNGDELTALVDEVQPIIDSIQFVED